MNDEVVSDLQILPEDEYEKFVEYDIATYPSDFTLQGINDLWDRNELTIPEFQRGYVWKLKQASLLIESFLLGLPVPPVFLYVSDQYTNLVIDGQQRLVTVRRFFQGYFGPPDDKGKQRVFRLEGLGDKSPYRGKTFDDLSDLDNGSSGLMSCARSTFDSLVLKKTTPRASFTSSSALTQEAPL